MEYSDFYKIIIYRLKEKSENNQKPISKKKLKRLQQFCTLLSTFAEQSDVTDISISVDGNDEISIILHGSCLYYMFNSDTSKNHLSSDCFLYLVASTKSFKILPSVDGSEVILMLTIPSIFK